MMRRLLFLGAITAVVAAIVFTMVKKGERPKVRSWDFSKSHRIDQVPWPKGKSPQDQFADFDLNGRVAVALPDGKHFGRFVRAVSFSRNGDSILAISFFLENQTLEQVYSTALALAKEWDVRTAPLDKWHQWADTHPIFGPGIPPQSFTRDNNRPLTRSIEILSSYDDEKPFRILFQVGWRDALPVPSMGPSTAPWPALETGS